MAAANRFCEARIWWAANRDAAALREFFETGDAQIAHVLATIRALRRIGALLFMTWCRCARLYSLAKRSSARPALYGDVQTSFYVFHHHWSHSQTLARWLFLLLPVQALAIAGQRIFESLGRNCLLDPALMEAARSGIPLRRAGG